MNGLRTMNIVFSLSKMIKKFYIFIILLSSLLYFVRISFHGKKKKCYFIVCMSGNIIIYLIRTLVAFRDNFSINAIIPSRAEGSDIYYKTIGHREKHFKILIWMHKLNWFIPTRDNVLLKLDGCIHKSIVKKQKALPTSMQWHTVSSPHCCEGEHGSITKYSNAQLLRFY